VSPIFFWDAIYTVKLLIIDLSICGKMKTGECDDTNICES
jgi:hypothetical protein